jgi:hypothetical protein
MRRWPSLVVWAPAVVLAAIAAQRLGDGFFQLVWLRKPPIDLYYRWTEVHRWFEGEAVYRHGVAVYPPASYVLLWPLLGWVGLTAARWLWALTTLGMLGWLAWLVGRESGSRTRAGWTAAALLALAVYASRAVMVNGQVGLHLLPPLVAGLLVLRRGAPTWRRDAAAAALLVVALVKPTLTAPLMWLVIAGRGWFRPAALVALCYVGLTLFAARFQPVGLVDLVAQFGQGAVNDAARASGTSHANLHHWIDLAGIGGGHTVASLVALAALGWWVHRARGVDPWIGIGVAGLVARFWTFHNRYDDILVLLPLVALLRIVTRRGAGQPVDRPAALMASLVAASLLIPARVLFPPWPWQAIEVAQTWIWLGALGFLVYRAERDRPLPVA